MAEVSALSLHDALPIFYFEDPAVLRRIIHIKSPQAAGAFLTLALLSPGLKNRPPLQLFLQIQIEGIKNKRLPFRIENSPKRALEFALTAYVININDVQAARAQDVSNIMIGCQQLLLPLRVFHLGQRLLR